MYDGLQLEISSTVDKVVEELRRALFAGEIAPGAPLREVALSEAMGVGRSTIREALGVLVAEGVAVRIPNKGVTVKQLTTADVADVSRARSALEAAGIRQWPAADDEQRQAVRDALENYRRTARRTSDPTLVNRAHLDVHLALVGLTGSRRLVAAADALAGEIKLALAQLERTRANLPEQVREHERLLGLLEAGDIDAALAEIAGHLDVAHVSLGGATGG